MALFEKGGLATRYLIEGQGPAVVLIHGVGARLENWDGVAEILAKHFMVLRYDLRGHGQSTRVPGPYSLPLFADDLRALLDHVGIGKAHIAGHSLGAMVAQMFTLRHGERVDRLALLSGVAGRTEEERERVAARIDLIRSGDAGEHFRRSVSRWFSDVFIAANPERIAAYAARNAENDPDCYAAAYRVLALEDLDGELEAISALTLIATGQHDLGSNPRMSELMHRRIKGSTLRILPGLKHSILIEAPQVVARMFVPFFRAEPVPTIDALIRDQGCGGSMSKTKQVIGGPYMSRGRKLTLSKAVRAGDFVFLTGVVPRAGDQPMTTGSIEDQTRVVCETIKATLGEAGCTLDDVVKAMVWLRERADFPGFNQVFGEYFAVDPPARSAVLNELLVDVRVEVEVIAFRPLA
jgi:pimeloyl-ACP methyl ester carboxylesterase